MTAPLRCIIGFVLCCCVVGVPSVVGGQQLVLESLHFVGNASVPTGTLKAQMASKSTPWYDVMPFVEPRMFDAGLFYGDLQRLEKFYQGEGFFQTHIDTTMRTGNNKAHVYVRIDEGPRSHIGQIQVLGLDALDLRLQQKAGALHRLKDRPFVSQTVSEEVTDLLRLFRHEGHAYAKAEISSYRDSLNVMVDVSFELGPQCEISDIQIVGHQGVAEKTIRKGLTFKVGQQFDGKELDDSRRQLYRSGVFRAVVLELPDSMVQQTPIKIRVSERPFRSVTLGGGYDTEVGLQASAAWLHRNFGGGASQLRVSSKVSTQARELVTGVRRPYFLGSRNWLNLSGFFQRRQQGDDAQDEVGGSASFERNITDRLDLLVQLSGGVVGTDADSAFSEVRAALRWDTRDDLFDPQKGALASLTVRERGWWLQSAWEFVEVTAEGRWFVPLPFQSVLAVKLLGGTIFQIHNRAEVPGIERYYSGGLNSVRGWGYHELGPKEIVPDTDPTKSDNVVPLGGTGHLEGSVEIRTRILSFLGVAGFVDAARIDQSLEAFSIYDLQWAVGGGLRLITPVGPVRFDAGYRISTDSVLDTHVDFNSPWRFHFSLGQAF